MGMPVKGERINIMFADNTIIVRENLEYLQVLIKEIKYMVISNPTPQSQLLITSQRILNSLEIRCRIGKARIIFRMSKLLKN